MPIILCDACDQVSFCKALINLKICKRVLNKSTFHHTPVYSLYDINNVLFLSKTPNIFGMVWGPKQNTQHFHSLRIFADEQQRLEGGQNIRRLRVIVRMWIIPIFHRSFIGNNIDRAVLKN